MPEAEVKENYERAYGKLSVAVVRVKSDEIEKAVQITRRGRGEILRSAQGRAHERGEAEGQFCFVRLWTEEQKKLAGKERVEVLQKLADRANDFNQAILEKDAQFDEVAAKFQLPVVTTRIFPAEQADPRSLRGKPQLAETAFQLKPERTEQRCDPGGRRFLHSAFGRQRKQPKPLTLEEAKPKIVDALKKQRVSEMVASEGCRRRANHCAKR